MDSTDKIARSAGVVGFFTFISRLFGLAREQTFAYFFGAGFAVDSFVAAFRIPNLLRDLFAEGALSQAFIPVFTEELTQRGKEEAVRLANLVLNFLIVVLIVIVFIGIIISPWIVKLIAPGFEAVSGKQELTTLLARIMFPFLLLIAVASLFMGVLNSTGYFAAPAFSPVMLNFFMILSGFLICPLFDPPIIGMAMGVLLGGLGQAAVQIPSLKKSGFKYKFILSFTDPHLKKVLFLMTPAVLGLASTQTNIFVNTLIASLLPQGSVSYLNYSFRLMHFPLGVFAIAIATVTLPAVSKYAAEKNQAQLVSAFFSALRLVFFLTLPALIFLAVARESLISLLYQYGKFTPQDTIYTAQALLFYAIGLFGYAGVRVIAPVFYALKNTKTPVKISVMSVILNIILNLLFMRPFGFRGLALATSLSAIFNMSLLLFSLNKKIGPLSFKTEFKKIFKTVSASVLMGIVLFSFLHSLNFSVENLKFLNRLGIVLACAGISFIFYSLFSRWLKVEEFNLIWRIIKARFNR